jgi:enoyl-CoA hydratase/carnithine racemase
MDLVHTQLADAISTITLNRPDKRNAMSGALMTALGEAVRAAAANPAVRVVVIRGAGPAFCAGLDLDELAEPREAGALDDVLVDAVLAPLEACPKPTIAMVHGDAIAGGCELALHCDLRIAAAEARFGMPVARLGLAAPYPLTLKLVETIGAAATKEMLFTGEMIDAARAFDLGMVGRVVASANLEAAVAALAATIAGNAPIAVHAMKEYVRRASRALTAIPHQDLDGFADRIRQSADLKEGLLARREKRRPVFSGR